MEMEAYNKTESSPDSDEFLLDESDIPEASLNGKKHLNKKINHLDHFHLGNHFL